MENGMEWLVGCHINITSMNISILEKDTWDIQTGWFLLIASKY